MDSLLLFRRALSSPTMCRFIPALSVLHFPNYRRVSLLGCITFRIDREKVDNKLPLSS
jgi:hypothetical protein